LYYTGTSFYARPSSLLPSEGPPGDPRTGVEVFGCIVSDLAILSESGWLGTVILDPTLTAPLESKNLTLYHSPSMRTTPESEYAGVASCFDEGSAAETNVAEWRREDLDSGAERPSLSSLSGVPWDRERRRVENFMDGAGISRNIEG